MMNLLKNKCRTANKVKDCSRIFFLILIIISLFQIISFGQENKELLLKKVINDISSYKNKQLDLVLRLKNYNKVFEKIVFYDRKNIDVIFDISSREKQRLLRNDMKNLHEGLKYKVKFVVKEVDSLGRLYGDLLEFKPLFMTFVP